MKKATLRKTYQEEIRLYIELICKEKDITERTPFYKKLEGYIQALWHMKIISYTTYKRYSKIAIEVYTRH